MSISHTHQYQFVSQTYALPPSAGGALSLYRPGDAAGVEVEVTELPVGKWTNDYKEWLVQVRRGHVHVLFYSPWGPTIGSQHGFRKTKRKKLGMYGNVFLRPIILLVLGPCLAYRHAVTPFPPPFVH